MHDPFLDLREQLTPIPPSRRRCAPGSSARSPCLEEYSP
jgi:hypothetical protein